MWLGIDREYTHPDITHDAQLIETVPEAPPPHAPWIARILFKLSEKFRSDPWQRAVLSGWVEPPPPVDVDHLKQALAVTPRWEPAPPDPAQVRELDRVLEGLYNGDDRPLLDHLSKIETSLKASRHKGEQSS